MYCPGDSYKVRQKRSWRAMCSANSRETTRVQHAKPTKSDWPPPAERSFLAQARRERSRLCVLSLTCRSRARGCLRYLHCLGRAERSRGREGARQAVRASIASPRGEDLRSAYCTGRNPVRGRVPLRLRTTTPSHRHHEPTGTGKATSFLQVVGSPGRGYRAGPGGEFPTRTHPSGIGLRL